MKLLLDENLSRQIVPALQLRWPGSSQVALPGLERATNVQLCTFVAENGFVICSKDNDFHRLVSARGYLPKLVHLALGNVTNDQILSAWLAAADDIEAAFSDTTTGSIVLT